MLDWPQNWKELAPNGFDAPKVKPDAGGEIGCWQNVGTVGREALTVSSAILSSI